jgi:hypothetical protein
MALTKLCLAVLPALVFLVRSSPISNPDSTISLAHPRTVHLDTFGTFQDGTYQMIYEPDGTTSVVVVNSTIPLTGQPVKRSANPLVPRACGMGVGCDGISLNHGDCDRAVEGLKAQCGGNGNHLNYKGSIYTIVGDTVAFYCQWRYEDSKQPRCVADSDTNANLLITDCCGLYGAGSFSDVENKLVQKSRTYSYGYTTVEHGWCVGDY